MEALGSLGVGNVSPMDAPGEGLGDTNGLHNKNKQKPRGIGSKSPAHPGQVSEQLLPSFFGYGINTVCELIGAILAPVRDLCYTMGTLFPWWRAILRVKGPLGPFVRIALLLGWAWC